MKITSLIAAAAIATASTSALADSANVTTQAGDVVMVEKNQSMPFPVVGLAGAGGIAASLLPILVVGTIAAVGASGGS